MPPIVWSIAGTDSSGGAGLAADQRACDAFEVHPCPVVAAVTAQHSRAVTRVVPVGTDVLDAQLAALADDMPPRVVKTGLLGNAEQVLLVARWIDRLREAGPVALVVDPVLGASSGASFADEATLRAYRDALLPRATVVTPNRREAGLLLADQRAGDAAALPALAGRLRDMGAGAVCITGGDSADHDGLVLDWLDTPHARGWLASPRVVTPQGHGTGCTFASSIAAAMALGFVPADAAVLAKMATAHALRHGHAAGAGPGPVMARPGFANDPSLLPLLSWGETPPCAPHVTTHVTTQPTTRLTPHLAKHLAPHLAKEGAAASRPLALYALVDSAERARQVLDAGVRTLQLRIKAPPRPDAAWHAALRDEVWQCVLACRLAGAELFVNDHWLLAAELGAGGVHLGQDDLLAMSDADRAGLGASGLALGISSHSLWELCRARSLAPRYIACGPVWPTLTKVMPWRPQGLQNLRWWQHTAGVPVVAIGGILTDDQVRQAASCGVDGVCVVRGLGSSPSQTVPGFAQAFEAGQADAPAVDLPALPAASLAAGHTFT